MKLREFDFGCLSQVSRLVKLPNLGLRDFVARMRDDGIGHINIGLIVAYLFISEFVLENRIERREDIESALSFVIHGQCEDHDP